MIKLLRSFLLFTALGLFPFLAWSAEKEPGGQGSIKSYDIGSNNVSCFKSKIGKEIDLELCADYTINWKLWTLMGEPVGDYNLSWKLRSITLKNSSRMWSNQLGTYYRPDSLPKELQKGVRSIELYIDGIAGVIRADNSYTGVFHSFNTGVPVRANAGSSYNTPGSSNWDKVFLRDNVCLVNSLGNPYLDAKAAKEEFAKGIKLNAISLCPKSGLSELTALESAIDKLCTKPGADEEYQFCPEQKPKEKKEKTEDTAKEQNGKDKKAGKKHEYGGGNNLLDSPSSGSGDDSSIADILDEDAERPQVQQRLAQLRAVYRTKAEAACQSTMRKAEQCMHSTKCTLTPVEEMSRQESSCVENMCGNQPGKRLIVQVSDGCPSKRPEPGVVNICLPRFGDGGINPAYDAWMSCAERAAQCRISSACQKQCYPDGYATQNACVERMMDTSGPTEQDARDRLKKEWNAKTRTGKSAPAGKKAPQPVTNFLD